MPKMKDLCINVGANAPENCGVQNFTALSCFQLFSSKYKVLGQVCSLVQSLYARVNQPLC